MEYVIPRPLQVVMDDVGWFNGKNDMEIGGPARTGLDRYHCLADYQAIEQFGALLGMKINCAFILGEWDLENELPRKIRHFSHFGDSWDNAKYRNPREMAEIAEFISSAEHIDVCLHGLYHGYYMPGVDKPHGSDYYYRKNGELILTDEQNNIVIVRTLAPTEYGIRCLMHDPWYRNSAANQNICYNQVGFASFYLGDEAPLPAKRTDICFG